MGSLRNSAAGFGVLIALAGAADANPAGEGFAAYAKGDFTKALAI